MANSVIALTPDWRLLDSSVVASKIFTPDFYVYDLEKHETKIVFGQKSEYFSFGNESTLR